MNLPKILCKVIEENNCPYYQLGDEFKLSENALYISGNKSACVILVLDITERLFNNKKRSELRQFRNRFYCSGCTGIIRLTYEKEDKHPPLKTGTHPTTKLLREFAFFQTLDDEEINVLLPLLKIRKFNKGEIIIQKGDPGKTLFIILTGKAEVLADNVTRLGYMEKGDVFGEISILVDIPATATISVVETLTALQVQQSDFKALLNRFPQLQMYFARLLAERLAKTNMERVQDFEAGITGKLSEMPPSDLLQTMNLNRKTGRLSLTFAEKEAYLVFRDGELLHVEYDHEKGVDAFFKILEKKEGRFKFIPGLSDEEMELSEIGEFMWLLMEGLNRLDEGNALR